MSLHYSITAFLNQFRQNLSCFLPEGHQSKHAACITALVREGEAIAVKVSVTLCQNT